MCPTEGCGRRSRKGQHGPCSKCYMRSYYNTLQGRAAVQAANKKWRKNNREYIAAYMADYRQRNQTEQLL